MWNSNQDPLQNVQDPLKIAFRPKMYFRHFAAKLLPKNSIFEQLKGIENGDEIIMINDSTATHTTDHDFGALFKQKKMTLRYKTKKMENCFRK